MHCVTHAYGAEGEMLSDVFIISPSSGFSVSLNANAVRYAWSAAASHTPLGRFGALDVYQQKGKS